MLKNTPSLFGTVRADIDYWPSYVDILTTVLMVFLLQNFLQTTLNVDNLEVAHIRQAQENLKHALENEFAKESSDGRVTLDTSPNLLQMRFSEEILFPSGQYQLSASGRNVLQRCARVLQRTGATTYEEIQVEGHTDSKTFNSTVYPRNNWELSSARALTVVQQMINGGLAAQKLSANGYAEFRPVASNAQITGQNLNRRIELRVVFSTPKQTHRRQK